MPGGARSGCGRKRIVIDTTEVEKLSRLQCTDEEIASFFGVSRRTIDRRKRQAVFAEAIERGRANGRLSLRRSLWALAFKGNPAANIFLAKNLLGYRDVLSNEHSGPDKGPIPMEPRPELSRLSTEELEQLVFLTQKMQGVGLP